MDIRNRTLILRKLIECFILILGSTQNGCVKNNIISLPIYLCLCFSSNTSFANIYLIYVFISDIYQQQTESKMPEPSATLARFWGPYIRRRELGQCVDPSPHVMVSLVLLHTSAFQSLLFFKKKAIS